MAPEPPAEGIAALLEESLDDLYEHAPCGYLSALADGTIVRVNQTFLDWTGYAREDLVGARRFQTLLTPGGQIYHETHYAPLLRLQGSVREIALQIRRADGSRLPVLINSVLRTAAGSEHELVRTTVFDATDRRAYEQELLFARRREAEARQRIERLQRLTQVLAATLDERAVVDATLDAAIEAVGARGARLELDRLDGERPEERYPRGELGSAAEEVELVASGRPLGRLRIGLGGRSLSEPERSLLLACGQQCAQALERARLHAETVRTARRTALLAELARGLEEARTYAGRARWLVQLLVRELADEARLETTDERGNRTVVAEAASSRGNCEHAVELPLRVRGQAVGTVTVRSRRPLGRRERDSLAEIAERAALALENARLYEHEHRVADALQRSMLTRRLPEDPRFVVAAHYQPAVELMAVGGDWYDAFETANGRLALVVGDVVGRGIEAASAMGQLRSAARALGGGTRGPAKLLQRLDEFVDHVEIARSSTLVYAELDLATGLLRYACAGHPPPVLLTGDGGAELLWEGRSPPLGAAPGIGERPEAELQLPAGARLFLYTDGLVEHRDRPIDDGLAELLAAVRDRARAPLPAVVEELPRLLVRGDAARDDVCLLGLALAGSRRDDGPALNAPA